MKLERSVPHGKYQKVTMISTDLSTKFKISFNDKSFDNPNAMSRALGASNLLSLVDGSRLIPQRSENNANGYTSASITESSDPSPLLLKYSGLCQLQCQRLMLATLLLDLHRLQAKYPSDLQN